MQHATEKKHRQYIRKQSAKKQLLRKHQQWVARKQDRKNILRWEDDGGPGLGINTEPVVHE